MLSPDAYDTLIAAFPLLSDLDSAAHADLRRACQSMELAPGTAVFEVGQPCERYLFVIDGSVRVHLLDLGGHEITLYRVGAGETCILTTAALLGTDAYAAYAVTERQTRAAGVDAMAFDRLIAGSAIFRRLVFGSYGERIVDLMKLVSNIAFTRIQVRLARCLLGLMDAEGCIRSTHERLSVELGTAREVISRTLKIFARQNFIHAGQGTIQVLDRNALTRIAEGEAL
ncbi:MAG: Crp/Fnr family transcriptional regulator [Rhodospirillales bacterium]|nr:Crp/Fnr family transcriptional regulator [Rhodospirillales bacterium]